MQDSQQGIVVTGANGQLGRALLTELSKRGHPRFRALVRSESARATIESLGLDPAPEIQIVDYGSPNAMQAALEGMHSVVHLVGIIKETSNARYEEAHEQSCHALSIAASRAGLQRIVYLSILGAAPDSDNECLASKGRAEALLLDDRVATTVLRVPMVLGGEDPATASLRRQAQARSIRLIDGGRTLQQPIDARDVLRAILAACDAAPGRHLSLDAGGPESLSHKNLVLRAARLWDNEPRIGSIPIGLARAAVRVVSWLSRNPPITPPMFEILQHDDRTDPSVMTTALGIELTPLAQTLEDFIGPHAAGASHPSQQDAEAGEPKAATTPRSETSE